MRKLLIWDGDNTLWQGIIANGDFIALPDERHAQCEMLSERGVLQAMATHNLAAEVEGILHRFDLSRFFLHNQAEFGTPKSEMVRRIINAYDISREEDVVYLDDDPFNLADVLKAFPGIVAWEPQYLEAAIIEFFTKDEYTEEDRLRVRRYQAETQRQQASIAYGQDHQAFLRSCQIKLVMRKATTEDVPRLVDLMARANRMAALSRTFSREAIIANLEHITVGEVSDKFGNYGLSAILMAHTNLEQAVVEIEALIISCRLQGRGVGSAILGAFMNTYPLDTAFRATWTGTQYNHGVRSLYEWYNFKTDDIDGTIYAVLDRRSLDFPPTKSFELPEWVEVVTT